MMFTCGAVSNHSYPIASEQNSSLKSIQRRCVVVSHSQPKAIRSDVLQPNLQESLSNLPSDLLLNDLHLLYIPVAVDTIICSMTYVGNTIRMFLGRQNTTRHLSSSIMYTHQRARRIGLLVAVRRIIPSH